MGTNKIDFTELAIALAQTLEEKNRAYGNSYDESIDTWGTTAMGVRIEDKYNRIKHLLLNSETQENDESLFDTFLDNAGYSLLALRYMINHDMVSEETLKKVQEKFAAFNQELTSTVQLNNQVNNQK